MSHDAYENEADIEIDIFTLLGYWAEAWRFVLICVLVVTFVTACSLRNATPVYEADMVVAPPSNSETGGNSQSLGTKLLSSLGGTGGGGDTQFDEFQYKFTSPSVVHAANKDGQLYAWIYPGAWNPQTRTWKKPGGIVQFSLGAIRSFFNRPDWVAPDDVMTSDTLQKEITFELLPKSSLTKISYQNSDPAIATAMLRRLYGEADRQLRDAERERQKTAIVNANSMLATTQNSDLRMAMAQVVANAQYNLMTVPGNVDYSANDIEAPFVSSRPVSPRIALSLAIAISLTLVVTSFAAIAYSLSIAELQRRGIDTGGLGGRLRNFAWFFSRRARPSVQSGYRGDQP